MITIVDALRLDNSAATHPFRLGPVIWTGRFVTGAVLRRTHAALAKKDMAPLREEQCAHSVLLDGSHGFAHLRDRAPSRATRPYARCCCGAAPFADLVHLLSVSLWSGGLPSCCSGCCRSGQGILASLSTLASPSTCNALIRAERLTRALDRRADNNTSET
ncbi:hypothetical protein [Streptomyces mirabilis]|uniref:hypothetical protein n=1 Tax=Streptomyces mirabilis TaxID=68239 RepID=UPI00224D7FCE|nr:hypothetical protein [Streptomyces mirabilis]